MADPDFAKLMAAEESQLRAKLEGVRATLSHNGEKGRALEQAAISLLRDLLPSEFGLSTGFVAYRSDGAIKLSPQLDVLIYDAARCGPIARFASCDVFPLEAIIGYVEVKTSIQSTSDEAQNFADNSIERCLEQNRLLRSMTERWYYTLSSRSPVEADGVLGHDLGIRSYVFSFGPQGVVASDAAQFAQRMANVSKKLGDPTHMHGVLVPGVGYFSTTPVPPNAPSESKWHIRYVTEHALSAFKVGLLHDLSRFPRCGVNETPKLDDYLAQPAWSKKAPLLVGT
jgi:hypothetical protein